MNLGSYMKKYFIAPLFITLFSLCLVLACKFEDDTDVISAPSVDNTSTSSKGISIARERLSSSIESVLVYRINVTDSPDEQVHIGTLYPKNISESLLIFNDQMVYASKTYKYRYVYIDSDSKKYYTEWTTELKVTDGNSTETSLVYEIPSEVYFDYSQSEYTLTLIKASNIVFNASRDSWLANYEPAVILKANDTTLSFSLSDGMFDGTVPFGLKAVIPSDFYDTKIYCKGIVGHYQEYNKDNALERIYWTEPSTIKVQKSGTDITEAGFTIESVSGDGGIEY